VERKNAVMIIFILHLKRKYPTECLTTLFELHQKNFVLNNDETLASSLLVRDVYKVIRKWLNASTFYKASNFITMFILKMKSEY